MSLLTRIAAPNPAPTLNQLQDDLLYTAAQARHALGLGAMPFEKAVRKGALIKTKPFGLAQNHYLGSHIKACARRLRLRAAAPRFIAACHHYDGPGPNS